MINLLSARPPKCVNSVRSTKQHWFINYSAIFAGRWGTLRTQHRKLKLLTSFGRGRWRAVKSNKMKATRKFNTCPPGGHEFIWFIVRGLNVRLSIFSPTDSCLLCECRSECSAHSFATTRYGVFNQNSFIFEVLVKHKKLEHSKAHSKHEFFLRCPKIPLTEEKVTLLDLFKINSSRFSSM
jgi:hypothetical protein